MSPTMTMVHWRWPESYRFEVVWPAISAHFAEQFGGKFHRGPSDGEIELTSAGRDIYMSLFPHAGALMGTTPQFENLLELVGQVMVDRDPAEITNLHIKTIGLGARAKKHSNEIRSIGESVLGALFPSEAVDFAIEVERLSVLFPDRKIDTRYGIASASEAAMLIKSEFTPTLEVDGIPSVSLLLRTFHHLHSQEEIGGSVAEIWRQALSEWQDVADRTESDLQP